MDKILIVKTSALGDIIHVYPVISYMKAKFPNAQIDWVVEDFAIDLVQAHPDINRAILVSTKKWRKTLIKKETWKQIFKFNQDLRSVKYDIAFDFQGNIKSGLIMAQVRSPLKVGFGWKSVPEKPNVLFTDRRFNPSANTGSNIREDYLSLVLQTFEGTQSDPLLPQELKIPIELEISDEEKKVVNAIFDNFTKNGSPIILICPGSAWKNKQMTIEALNSFLEKVDHHSKPHFIFAWGSPGEKLIAEDLQRKFFLNSTLLEKMSLPTLQNLMGKCDLIIAMDSLPLHLAGTTKTPTFSVFGASSANKYKPLGDQHVAYQGKCPYNKSFEKRCPILRTCATGACIRNLDGDEVFKAFVSATKQRDELF